MEEIVLNTNHETESLLTEKTYQAEFRRKYEMKWNKQTEHYFNSLKSDCKNTSTKHGQAFKKNKVLYQGFALPAIIIPLIMSVVTNFTSEYPIINPIVLASLAILNGINTFFNFGKKSQAHSEFSNKYNDIVEELETELIKEVPYRESCEVYLERIKNLKAKLDDSAPDL